jgi:hypothetical protein
MSINYKLGTVSKPEQLSLQNSRTYELNYFALDVFQYFNGIDLEIFDLMSDTQLYYKTRLFSEEILDV